MPRLGSFSIRRKLTLIMMATTSVSLLLACVVIIGYDRMAMRSAAARQTATLADVLGENSTAALALDDPHAAKDVLLALRAETHVVAACIYSRDGRVFASYVRPNSGNVALPDQPLATVSYFENGHVRQFRQIQLAGAPIGSIYIDSDMRQISEHIERFVGVMLLMLLLSSLIAYILGSRLQRVIYGPVLSLVQTVKAVSEHKDYSLRATANSDDEIGLLVAEFNGMLEQIHRRDEELQHRGETLEQQISERTAELRSINVKLANAHAETKLFLASIPSLLIGIDENANITRWNLAAANAFGVLPQNAVGHPITACGIKWLRADMEAEVTHWLQTELVYRCDNLPFERNQKTRFLGVEVHRLQGAGGGPARFIITGADITERKVLESQLREAHKLEAIGQLAAGIAHEINTPTQYVANNTTFLKEAWGSIVQLLELLLSVRHEAEQGAISEQSLARFKELAELTDFEYLRQEIPSAIDQSLEGLNRVAKIVKAMKEFSHPGAEDKTLTDINHAIETTVAVARNEWKYVSEVVTELAEGLPLAPCLQGELNQVLLNLIVNAAQAIAGAVGDGSVSKGKITIRTRHVEDWVEVSIQDTGVGIPPEIRSRIFEPFFTTKPVGKGTGQGLSLAHATIVKRHQGQIWFESEVGQGTTFFIRLPLQVQALAAAGA